MAVCSFIGHREVYDADILNRLQAAVNQIVEENDSVEFMIYYQDVFFYCCLLASLRAKSHSRKDIKISLVVSKFQYNAIVSQEGDFYVPFCMLDKVYVHDKEESNRVDVHGVQYLHFRLTLKKATHIISYLYGNFYSTEIGIYNLSRVGPNVKIIPVTSEETNRVIAEYAGRLLDREQIALQKWIEKVNLYEIGLLLGLSRERVRQLLVKSSRAIRKQLQRRCNAVIERQKFLCGVFALGEETDEMMDRFEEIIIFLVAEYKIKQFYIEASHATPSCISVLKDWPDAYYKLQVTAVTAEEIDLPDTDNQDSRKKYCPPCDGVMNVGLLHMDSEMRDLSTVAAIMEKCDFCVFDFSAMPYAEKLLRDYVRKDQIVLLDLGKRDYIDVEWFSQQGKQDGQNET